MRVECCDDGLVGGTNVGLIVFCVFIGWMIIGGIAAAFGPSRYALHLLCATLFIGPFAIGVALVMRAVADSAPSERIVPAGRRRLGCSWCGAKTDVPNDWKDFDCWQCGADMEVPA